jgi:hypothetical protein
MCGISGVIPRGSQRLDMRPESWPSSAKPVCSSADAVDPHTTRRRHSAKVTSPCTSIAAFEGHANRIAKVFVELIKPYDAVDRLLRSDIAHRVDQRVSRQFLGVPREDNVTENGRARVCGLR